MAFYDTSVDVIDEVGSESDDEWGDPPTLPLEPAVRVVSPDRGRHRHQSSKRRHASSARRGSGQSSSYESSVEELAEDIRSRDRERRRRDGSRRDRERHRWSVDRGGSRSSSTGSPGRGVRTQLFAGADRRGGRVVASPTSSAGRRPFAGAGSRSQTGTGGRQGRVAGPLESFVGRRSFAGAGGRSQTGTGGRQGRVAGQLDRSTGRRSVAVDGGRHSEGRSKRREGYWSPGSSAEESESSARASRSEKIRDERRIRTPSIRKNYEDREHASSSRRDRSGERRRHHRSPSSRDQENSGSRPRDGRSSDQRQKGKYAAGAKLGTFDGSTNLETFLAKFDRCSAYYNWNEDDELFQLTTALQGVAGQVLWDLGKDVTARSLRKLLRCRFGEENQAERFRAELKGRRRGPGESLQTLYTDICRLMALAYPGPTSTLSDIVGRDAFLDALNNNKLRIRILETEPATLEDALRTAMRLEAYEGGRKADYDEPSWKNRRAAPMSTEVDGEELEEMKVRMAGLEEQLRSVAVEQKEKQDSAGQVSQSSGKGKGKKARKLASDTAPASPATTPAVQWQAAAAPMPDSGAAHFAMDAYQLSDDCTDGVARMVCILQLARSAWQGNSAQPGHRWQQGRSQAAAPVPQGSNACHRCGSLDHWKRDCPVAAADARNACRKCNQPGHWARDCPQKQSAPGAAVLNRGLTRKRPLGAEMGEEVYLRVGIEGKRVHALLDTGCEFSVMGRSLLPMHPVQPTQFKLFAANGTAIPLLGQTVVKLRVGSQEMETTLLVTESMNELILGADWLVENNCCWNFGTAQLNVNGRILPLFSKPASHRCSRIYASETVTVHSQEQTNVPVKIVGATFRPSMGPLVTEPREIQEGVLSARVVLPGGTDNSAACVLNLSERDYTLKVGDWIATAEEVDSWKSAVKADGAEVRAGGITVQPTAVNGAHIQQIIDQLPESLSEEQRRISSEFILRHSDMFSASEFDLGRVDLVKHEIDTGDNRPFKQQLRRHPMGHLEIIDDHVEKMLAHGIISPTSSQWASNIVLVRRTGSQQLRFCIDYRQLNTLTRKDSYPLPRIDSCMDALGGAKYFSTLDLKSGYWQVALDEESAQKAAFVTRKGVWRFNVLPFGLSNAPAIFQRLMDLVLAGLTWQICLAFLDDVIVMSATFEQHLERLTQVFDRIKKANLKLHPGKCKLFQERVKFLGSIVSGDGIAPDPERVRAVETWPTPKNLTEVRGFVGLASYYRRHVEHFAEIARPLHYLMKKDVKFHWGAEQQEAFEELKRRLMTAPLVMAPREHGQYTVDVDASGEALGAVLQQEQDGRIVVIAYASRRLSDAERNYSTTKKELLAIIYGLKQFRHYLLCREFLLRTDHAALTTLMRTPDPPAQQARWLDFLAEYNFKIVHRAGELHRNADSLSRRPPSDDEETMLKRPVDRVEGRCGAVGVEKRAAESGGVPLDLDRIKEEQERDEVIETVRQWMIDEEGEQGWRRAQGASLAVQQLWSQRETLEIVDGILLPPVC